MAPTTLTKVNSQVQEFLTTLVDADRKCQDALSSELFGYCSTRTRALAYVQALDK